jgi:hypothetical protein
LGTSLDDFQFNDSFGGRSSSEENFNQDNDRPLATLEGKPAFLEPAAKWAATAKLEESAPFAVLLAQYGQFGGVDRLLARSAGNNAAQPGRTDDAVLTGIALSQDAKYLPALVKMVAARNDQYGLRKVLQALQGMRGADARQLRLDINKKLRAVNSP